MNKYVLHKTGKFRKRIIFPSPDMITVDLEMHIWSNVRTFSDGFIYDNE